MVASSDDTGQAIQAAQAVTLTHKGRVKVVIFVQLIFWMLLDSGTFEPKLLALGQAVFNRCDVDKSGNIDVSELGTLSCILERGPKSIQRLTRTLRHRKCMRLLGMNPTEKEAVQ